ncbi:RNA helicase [Aphelenchoides besseyi]|nr:RNA helicase [Aphelenchoides besseyi]
MSRIFKKKMRPKGSFKSSTTNSRRTPSTKDGRTNTSAIEVAQRFARLAAASQYDCLTILKELKNLRVFLTAEGLDWLQGFCEAGGASTMVNFIDRISDITENNISKVPQAFEDQLIAGIISEHMKCVRGILNNTYGLRYCCVRNFNVFANLINLLRVCNKTTRKEYDSIKEEILRLLNVISLLEEGDTESQSGKHRKPRFQVLVNCLECQAATLHALRLIFIIFDRTDEEEWKVRVMWRRELWALGFGKHFDIQNSSLPIPEKSVINLLPPKDFKPSEIMPNVSVKSSAPPPPPPVPSAASLKPNGGIPQPAATAKQGVPLPPPLPSNTKAPPPPGPPPPLNAPFGNVKVAPQLPSYLQPKNEAMTDVATRKIVQWEESKIPSRMIKDNSIWTKYQNVEREFATDKLYVALKSKFSRPESSKPAHVFKRKLKEPVVVKNEKQLQMWDILGARTIPDVKAFKTALLLVDLKYLSEDTVSLVQGALLEPNVLKQLRETPIEKFENAPNGEQLIATLSHIKDLANRLRSIHLLITFKKTIERVRSNASTFAEACDEIRNSSGLGAFAVLVLVCGNYMMRTKANRQLCYGYLMRLLPKLIETKDVLNKQTLLDHLILLFDKATDQKYVEFPAKDFVQVERAKHLIFSDVIKSIDELHSEIKRVSTYSKTFVKQSEDDQLGRILETIVPQYTSEIENLLYLKKSVESKAAEIERYFCFDAKSESKNKYTLEDLIRDIFIFSTLYKSSYKKLTEETVKPTTTHNAYMGKARERVKKPPLGRLTGNSDNLLERLEQTLATNNYRMAKTPRKVMSYGSVPPPDCLRGREDAPNWEKKRAEEAKVQEYNNMTSGYKSSAKRQQDGNEDDYFDDSDEEKTTPSSSNKALATEEDDEDELDAFMAEINEQAQKDVTDSKKREEKAVAGVESEGGGKGRDDIDEDDMQESYFKFLEDYKEKHQETAEDNYEYDEDGNVIWTWKKTIDPLPQIDHSQLPYGDFVRHCYTEHEDIQRLTPIEVFDLRNTLDIRVFGNDPPKPCVSFAHFGFNEKLMNRLQRAEFEKPTPIQAQAIPAALSGRDVLGLAATGSGKTLAYVLPAIVHILSQPEQEYKSVGPFVVIVVPTRELALQVYEEARQFGHAFGLQVVCAYGGGNKYEQQKALQNGADICICTPGRLIDLIKIEATDFIRTSFLVFDEADRMFDLGFEAQVRSISDHIRPDRQCLMFSATFQPKIEKLASYALHNPVKVLCGEVGEANTDVTQQVHVLPNADAKWHWLFTRIVQFASEGKVLVFVTKKTDAEIVAEKLRQRDVELVLLHGDMLQYERNERLGMFKSRIPVLVATDVAARGLDIREIRNVVNFDVARDIDTHVHRIGRTGRAGQGGTAYTLMTEKDKEFAGPLMKSLENAGQEVPSALIELAKASKWYAENGTRTAAAGRPRLGLGYSEKPKNAAYDPVALLSKPSSSQTPTFNKAIERAKGVAESSTGVALSRYDTMRQVLKSYNHFDALIDDISQTKPEPIGEVYDVEHLSAATFPTPSFPVKGYIYGRNLRYMVPLVVQRSKKSYLSSVHVWFLIDTSAPFTCLTFKTLEALRGAGNFIDRSVERKKCSECGKPVEEDDPRNDAIYPMAIHVCFWSLISE